ncbi:MAG: hypothetical protein JST04_15350 [Bdellovibrionales bacterium]|nr:hypothetical protein [Bdellovibrionales bacterium]
MTASRRRENRGYYLKFDLTKPSIAGIPDLQDIVRATGAIRACMIVKTQGAWDRIPNLPATHLDDPHWYLIKIPSIDGTELWIVPESKQSEIELKVGFDRPSEPLLTILAKTALSMTYRDPLFRNEIQFDWRNHVICTSLTGATLLSPTGDWSLEQLENLKDLGNFAFED